MVSTTPRQTKASMTATSIPAQLETVDPDQMTGPELIQYIGLFPTLDAFLDRDPFAQPYTDEELLARTRVDRAERALFNIKEQNKKDKKAGADVTDPEADPDGEVEA